MSEPPSSAPSTEVTTDKDGGDPASARAQELNELVGRTISERYRVTALLGAGGMGAVYEAEHLGIGKKVALKFLSKECAKEPSVASRFAREARAASAIESEHIVTVFDAGTDQDRPYIAMELLRGEDFGARLKRLGKVPQDEAVHVIAQTLRGLADAHEAGIIHRDLKPDNVFLVDKRGDSSFVKIVDFGVSKFDRPGMSTAPLALTQKGTVVGTPYYMSPEQAQAVPDLDARADLFSVGAMLFEALAGRPPHTGGTYEAVIVSICMNDAPDLRTLVPETSPSLARFVARALQRDRTKRFTSARQMLVALAEFAPRERQSGDAEARKAAASNPLMQTKITLQAPPGTPAPTQAVVAAEGPRGTSTSWIAADKLGVVSSRRPPDKSRLTLILVGAAAMLAGVLATVLFVKSTHKPSPVTASSSSTAAPSSSASTAITSASASASTAPSASAAPLVSASASASPEPTATTPAPSATAVKTAKPGGKHAGGGKHGDVDIDRDFP
ncbi:MAG TPA: serine/threonine-protein kinase [Polyangiaceae bacterium]